MKEIRGVQQVAGERPRRWFFSHEQDLLVWFDADGRPAAFQLAYGKYQNEHALRWKAGRGYTHHRVDDGEGRITGKSVPILFPDGVFQAASVLDEFLKLSAELPPGIVEFVATRLREHPEYRE